MQNQISRGHDCSESASAEAWELRRQILGLFKRLEGLPSLAPSPEVNRLFEDLVSLVLPWRPANLVSLLLTDPEIVRIRQRLLEICAAGEYELERHWAAKAATSGRPNLALRRFPYYANYVALTRFEHSLLSLGSDKPVRSVLFVGSGPLPLTSILLASQFGTRVDNVDISADACRLSEQLVHRLELSHLVRIHCADVRNQNDLRSYEVVALAALAGITIDEKRTIIGHIERTISPGCRLLVRTAEGLRRLVYPRVEERDLDGLTVHLAARPWGEVVNSVLIAEKPPCGAVINRATPASKNSERSFAGRVPR